MKVLSALVFLFAFTACTKKASFKTGDCIMAPDSSRVLRVVKIEGSDYYAKFASGSDEKVEKIKHISDYVPVDCPR